LQHFKENCLISLNDSVAQLVEHYTFNVVVLGSNPSGITRFNIKTTQNPAIARLAGFLLLGNCQNSHEFTKLW
jgi:hypothetical protein